MPQQQIIPSARVYAAQPVLVNGALAFVRPLSARAGAIEGPITVEVLAGVCSATVELAQIDAESLVRQFLPFAHWSDFPQTCWSDLLKALLKIQADPDADTTLTVTAAVLTCAAGSSPDQVFDFEINMAGITFLVRVGGDASTRARLETALREWPLIEASDGYRTLVRVCVGHALVTLSELRKANIGDVVLLKDDLYRADERMLVLGESRCACWTRGKPVPALSDFLPVSDQIRRDYFMDKDSSLGALDPHHIVSDLGDLEIPLIFEVGRTAVKLSHLSKLSEGDLFEVSFGSDEVNILHGRTILGKGRLVSVGGKTGVQINKLFAL